MIKPTSLAWQEDSLLLNHQGSPGSEISKNKHVIKTHQSLLTSRLNSENVRASYSLILERQTSVKTFHIRASCVTLSSKLSEPLKNLKQQEGSSWDLGFRMIMRLSCLEGTGPVEIKTRGSFLFYFVFFFCVCLFAFVLAYNKTFSSRIILKFIGFGLCISLFIHSTNICQMLTKCLILS